MQSATTTAALSLHLPVRQQWFERRREEIIEPDLPILDPAIECSPVGGLVPATHVFVAHPDERQKGADGRAIPGQARP